MVIHLMLIACHTLAAMLMTAMLVFAATLVRFCCDAHACHAHCCEVMLVMLVFSVVFLLLISLQRHSCHVAVTVVLLWCNAHTRCTALLVFVMLVCWDVYACYVRFFGDVHACCNHVLLNSGLSG